MQKDKCVVYIEDWQMQCCGTPFIIGDCVEWTVIDYGDDFRDQFVKPDYYYENHGSAQSKELFRLTGTVASIKACYYTLEHKSGEGKIASLVYVNSIEVTEADGWNKDIDGKQFGSYIVELDSCSIHP